jgi:hypothetical protein
MLQKMLKAICSLCRLAFFVIRPHVGLAWYDDLRDWQWPNDEPTIAP